ncbi:HlyD family type I secretion periplasmic adaptor subunit [Oxalobacteraceae bacterium CAVE-383]|nr:HlyD family type I secretion periplasmic adaptor subunit [Oxalobacteraceae bacterium CAVE-383]
MSIGHRLGAVRELLRRYGAVFKHFWNIRHSMRGPLLSEEEADFLPAALSLQEKPVSPTARLTARILMTLVVVLIGWSILGKVDIIVNATGKIIPSGHTKTIASVDVAAVSALHVFEGKPVKAGDVLIELDSSAADSEHDKAIGDATVATIQMARSRAMIAALNSMTPPKLPKTEGISETEREAAQSQLSGQYSDFKAKLDRIDGEIARYSQALPLATQRANDYKILKVDHDVSEHAWEEKEQARIDLVGQLTDARNQRGALISQTRKEAYDALTEGSKLAASSGQDARRAGEHSKLLQLTAPVDGTVQQLNVHTVGGVVPAAQPLMQIVPRADKVEVEAFLENKDVGFVQEGQAAAVKIDTFEYTKYGTIPAVVTTVSRDAIQDEKKGLIYSVKVTLDKSQIDVEGKMIPLSAGMSVNVEIKTGTRRIIEYVLSPLVQHQHEALNER